MLNFASYLLKNENIVSIPTETVYGLAGSIYSEKALKKIFSIKNRPFFDPLIVHISSIEEAKALAKEWHPAIECIAKKFWPGPLTLVLKKHESISDLITSGLQTVALRMPDHLLTLKLIRDCGFPLAAPSANKFGKTSPTTAQHVRDEFDNIYVVDGGPCEIGLESTVLAIDILDDTTLNLSILRKGFVKLTQITSLLNSYNFNFKISIASDLACSPGQMKHHYMPNKPLIILDDLHIESALLNFIKTEIDNLPSKVEHVDIVKPDKIKSFKELILSENPKWAARELYSKLRESSLGSEDIIIFKIKKYHVGDDWEALLERLLKASTVNLNTQAS